MPTRRELNLQKKIVQEINWKGGMVAIRAQTPYTIVGDPDITGCIRGQHVEIEVKEPGEEPTKIQEQRMALWRKVGAVVIVAHSVDEAIDLLFEKLK